MDKNVVQIYDKLTPRDQLLVFALIVALSEKDEQIAALLQDVYKQLDKTE